MYIYHYVMVDDRQSKNLPFTRNPDLFRVSGRFTNNLLQPVLLHELICYSKSKCIIIDNLIKFEVALLLSLSSIRFCTVSYPNDNLANYVGISQIYSSVNTRSNCSNVYLLLICHISTECTEQIGKPATSTSRKSNSSHRN